MHWAVYGYSKEVGGWSYLQNRIEAPTAREAVEVCSANFSRYQYYHVYQEDTSAFFENTGELKQTRGKVESEKETLEWECPECLTLRKFPVEDYLCPNCRANASLNGDGDNDSLPRHHHPDKSTV